jgi:ABC-type transport system involved in multi-copper enzyme maturation permease subunit
MFRNIVAAENTKNFKRSLLRVELGLLAVLVFSIFTFIYFAFLLTPVRVPISASERAQLVQLVSWPGSLVESQTLIAGSELGVLLLVVFVGAVTAQEYGWRTFRLWLSRGTPRNLLLAAKFTALLLPIFAIVLTALVSTAVSTAIISTQIHGSLHLEQLNMWQLSLSILRTAYSLLPFAAMAYLLAIASRSAAVAIGVSFAYIVIVEDLLVQALGILKGNLSQVALYLPGMLSNSLLSMNQMNPNMASGEQSYLLNPVSAAAGVAIWTLSFFAIALWIFRRQDFTG